MFEIKNNDGVQGLNMRALQSVISKSAINTLRRYGWSTKLRQTKPNTDCTAQCQLAICQHIQQYPAEDGGLLAVHLFRLAVQLGECNCKDVYIKQ